MGQKIKILICFLISIFISSSSVISVSALANYTDKEKTVWKETKNIFWNPYEKQKSNEDDECLPGEGAYDGTPTAGLSALQSAFVDKYAAIAIQLGKEYGIPWETVMAQGILESTSGTSRFARERNNFFGIGAFDSNPDHAYRYATPAEGWRGYFENIKKTATYRAHGAFNYPNDPYGYLAAIKAAGYATDPNYIAKVTPLIKAIQNRAKEKGWYVSGVTNPSETTTDQDVYCPPKDSDGDGNYDGGADDYGSSKGNGNINATALALSWPDRSHGIDDPKPAYKTALGIVGFSTNSDPNVARGSSCDVFVATVLKYSGVDPNVVCCGASNMLHYFANSSLYEEIPNLGNTSNMQPGDIRASGSHVEIYVIDESGNAKIASASNGDRTADHFRGYYAGPSFRIFRFKGGN